MKNDRSSSKTVFRAFCEWLDDGGREQMHRDRRAGAFHDPVGEWKSAVALKEIRDHNLHRENEPDFYLWCARYMGLLPKMVDRLMELAAGQCPKVGERTVRTQSKSDAKQSRIYFLKGADCIKIGVSTNIERRLAMLRAASPVSLELLGMMDGDERTEQSIRRIFDVYRVHGEWFQDCSAIREFIAKHAGCSCPHCKGTGRLSR